MVSSLSNAEQKRLIDLQEEYRSFQEIKKTNPPFCNGFTLFNQKVLTAAGHIHGICLKYKDNPEVQKIWHDFLLTFPGLYYMDWRKNKAISIRACQAIYDKLGVKMPFEPDKNGFSQTYRGETFYAGIPPTTLEELETVQLSDDSPSRTLYSEKIGIDGKYHAVDQYGDFREIYDFNDIYGDGTMVTKSDLDKFCKENTK
jgi:hypothetical protein